MSAFGGKADILPTSQTDPKRTCGVPCAIKKNRSFPLILSTGASSIGLALALCVAAGVAAHAQSHGHGDAPSDTAVSADATFASQMMQAMDRMDAGMMAAKPMGDADRDFAAMMIDPKRHAFGKRKALVAGKATRAYERRAR
jgi:hypothetical protein